MKKAVWSDLADDIVRLIMEKLCSSERVPLCLVCKNWHDRIREIKNTKEILPWLMYYGKGQKGDLSICKLCDPSAKRSYTLIAKNIELCGAEPYQSRHGWVLFSKGTSRQSHGKTIKHFFFYSPFTNQVIELPKLDKIYEKASFSLIPTCPDCMVIALRIPKSGELEIKAWQPGYETWKTFEFRGEYLCDGILEVAYADESFYCTFTISDAFDILKMGAFNIKQQEWQLFPAIFEKENCVYDYLSAAINGDLLLVPSIPHNCIYGPWRFDLSKKKWVEDDKIMEKQVTFIDRTSFSVPAIGNARQSAGMIIRSVRSNPTIFRYDHFGCTYWWRPQFPVCDWIIENDDKLQKIWIQPPF